MDPIIYKIIHLIGISALALGMGGMLAGGPNRKPFAILQGIALLVMLITGFGMVAKFHYGFQSFVIVKIVLWLVIGMMPFIIRKLKLPLGASLALSLTLVGLLAWLGVMKPVLW